MAHFLFVDESGYDAGESPYAGIAVEDRDLWSLVKDIRVAELSHFGGVQYSGGDRELKAKKLLKRKVFRQAAALDPIPPVQRAALARECLEQGDHAGGRQITALAQAKIALRSTEGVPFRWASCLTWNRPLACQRWPQV